MKRKVSGFGRERRSKPFLLLEIGILNVRLYLVQAAFNPVKTTMLCDEPLLPGGISPLVETVQKVLEFRSKVRDLAIVMNSPMIHHQLISIPLLKAAERKRILELEAKHLPTSDETPGAVSFWSAGKIKRAESTNEYVLYAEISRTAAEALQAVIRGTRYRWIGFTSHAQMVSLLLRECPQEGDRNVAMVEVNERDGSVNLFHSNVWNMERHFLFGGPGALPSAEALSTQDAEKLKLELGRALQYFKQQVRNENIGRIYLYGRTARASEIGAFLEASFDIPVTPMVLDAKRFGSGNRTFGNQNLLFTIPHAAALHSDFKNYIDFIPPGWDGDKQAKIRTIALTGSAIAVYAFLGSVACLFQKEVAQITAREKARMQLIQVSPEDLQRHQKLQTDRSFAFAAQQSLRWQYERNHVLAELARELAGIVPDNMRVTALEIVEEGNAWRVKLDAEIQSPSGSASQELLLRFQEQIGRMTQLKQLTWGEVRLTDLIPAAADRTKDARFQTENLLTFTMRGVLSFPGHTAKPHVPGQ